MKEEIRTLYERENISCQEDILFGQIGSHKLMLDLIADKDNDSSDKPCIIWIHGGAWCLHELDKEYRPDEEFIPFLKSGYLIAAIDYRLVDEGAYPAQLEDCKCAVRFLRANASKYGIHPDKIYAWGESAGGHMAGLLGTTTGIMELEGIGGNPDISSHINGACLWYPPVKFDELCREEKDRNLIACLVENDPDNHPELIRSLSPYYYIDENAVPFLIMHGDRDDLVSIDQSNLFVQRLKEISQNEVEYIIVPGQGHGFFLGHDYYERIKDFFDRLAR